MLWGEIKVDSDDLKHMVHRNGGFIELYNNIMTCLGDLGLLLAVPPWGRSGVERRLVLINCPRLSSSCAHLRESTEYGSINTELAAPNTRIVYRTR